MPPPGQQVAPISRAAVLDDLNRHLGPVWIAVGAGMLSGVQVFLAMQSWLPLIWTALFLGLMLTRVAQSHAYARARRRWTAVQDADGSVLRWERQLGATLRLHGMMWGVLNAAVILATNDPLLQLVVIATAIGIRAGNAVRNASLTGAAIFMTSAAMALWRWQPPCAASAITRCLAS